MYSLIDLSIRSYRVVLLTLAFILIAGSIAYNNIPKESSPDVQVPIIYVSMRLEGISPEDAERLLIRPMEQELRTIDRVKKMSAEATEGFASVVLEFQAGFNPDAALADVRAAVDKAKPKLPKDAEEPEVNEVNFSQFPVINVILSGDTDLRTLVFLARRLRDKLEGLSSVLEAKLAGDREEVLDIIIKPQTLETYNINPAEVLERVQRNNLLIAAGRIDQGGGRFSVKLPGLIETAEDLYNVPIISTPQKVIVLGDIAEVRRTFKDAESIARINGKRAVGVSVAKRAGENIIDTVAAVKAIVEEERAYFPPSVKVSYSGDTSGDIRDMLRDLENNVLFAALLVMIMVIWMMGVRSSLLISLSIPGSFLIGILFLAAFGYTLNIVVLFSLILSSGMLVDAAIVVCEYADQLMEEDREMSPMEAYAAAAKRMALPIISSVMTIIAVFLPLLFWPGIVGQFMKYMPITMIVTLAGSLAMALIFIPAIGARLKHKPRLHTSNSVKDDALTKRYIALLQKVLRHPWKMISGVLASMVLIFVLFGTIGKGVEFFPDIEPKNANMLVKSVGNLSLDQKNALLAEVEERLKPLANEVRFFYTQAGQTTLRDIPEDVIGVVQMEFRHWRVRRPVNDILAEARERVAGIAGIEIETAKQEEGPPTGKALQLEFSSRFPEKIAPEVEKFLGAMREMGGFLNIEDDRPKPSIVWEYKVDRVQAGRNNLAVGEIGQIVKLATNGVKVNEYRPDDSEDELDIVVRFPEEYRNLSQLNMLRVMTASGALEPLTNFITRTSKQAVSLVRRMDGVRVMNVKADVEEGILPDNKVREVRRYFEQNPPDPQVSLTFRGEDEEQAEAMQFLATAFVIAIFMMVLMMTAQFNSFYRMFVIMSAIVLSTGGVLLGTLVAMQPFGIVMGGVGVISLAGIVVSNNIILIDYYDALRCEGMEVMQALVEASVSRFRAILLTAGTTVVGLIPMVFGWNIDFFARDITVGAPSSQWWTQLSTAVAGGLTFATILTLFLTPCLMLVWDRRKGRGNRV
jgi:multidrug efflux pump